MSFLPVKLTKLDGEDIYSYIARLYSHYLNELKTNDFTYKGLFVHHKTEPDVDGKDGGFWHLITKDYYNKSNKVGKNKNHPVSLPCKASNGMMVCTHICKKFHDYDPFRTTDIYYPKGEKADPRFICLNRCERINWIKPILKEAGKNPDKFKIWNIQEGNQNKTHIWYEEEDFLIVLGRWKSQNAYNMLTSFITNYKDKRAWCEKKYQEYIKNEKVRHSEL